MNTENLKTQVAELLSVQDSEKNLAFTLFTEKLKDVLNIGEAIEIPELGIFHKQEKIGNTESNILIFSPTKKSEEEETIFLTIGNDDDDGNNNFNENVFDVGIDKPILPVGDKQKSEEQSLLETKINDFIEKGNKIENFDLWDDYLDKRSASILSEETDIDNYLQSDDNIPNEDDFMEIDEDELLSEIETSELNDQEDSLIETGDETIIDLTEKDLEPANELLEDIPIETEEIISNTEEVENINKEEEIPKADESVFYEAEDDALDEILEQIDIDEEKLKEDETSAENAKEVLPIIDEKVEYVNPRTMKKKIVGKKHYSPTIYALIAAFFIVGAIGIYYLFFNNPTWLEDPNEVEIKLSEKHQKEFEEAKRKAKLLAEKQKNNTQQSSGVKAANDVKEKRNETTKANTEAEKNKKEETKTTLAESNGKKKNTKIKETKKTKTIAAKPKTKPKSKSSKVITNSNNLTEVGRNIYFDGKNYLLQVSSWPRKSLAEKEVNRLTEKGYDAFIMKAYIPRYQKYWYRVRIGNLATIGEAKKINAQLK